MPVTPALPALHSALEHSAQIGLRMGLLLLSLREPRRLLAQLGARRFEELVSTVHRGIAACLRRGDEVVRCGEHDFMLLLPGLLNGGHAALAARKILGSFQAPLRVGSDAVKVRLAVGITLFPDHGDDAELLLAKTQFALLASEREARHWVISDSAEVGLLSAEWRLEAELDAALEAGDFELHYQPQIDLASGQPCGVEALVRWQHRRRGLLLPHAFVPICERSGKASRLTQWALNTALRQSGDWSRRFGALPLAVNVPTAAAENPEFPELVSAALGVWSQIGSRLTVEITESSLLRSPELAQRVLRTVRALGVRVSIDDFGTGYSSLGQFRDLPADELKIDVGFVQAIRHSEIDRRIVQLILGLAQAFDLELVAEGVEDTETLALLHAFGCRRVQGFLLARPMTQAEFCTWLDGYPSPELRAVLCLSTAGRA